MVEDRGNSDREYYSSDQVSSAPRRRGSAQLRLTMLSVASALFEAHGFDGVTTREICRQAGVSTAVLFRNFATKKLLYHEAMSTDPDSSDRARQPSTQIAEQTRHALLESARTLFAKAGYSNTSTRQIAIQANVQEVSIFRYFGNKASLFREAVFDPFGDYIKAYIHSSNNGAEPRNPFANPGFLGGLYTFLLEHGDALLTLVATRVHEGADVIDRDEQQSAMSEIMDPLTEKVENELRESGLDGVHTPIATRITIAMIGGTVIFKDWLFSDSDKMSDDDIIAEMSRYVTTALYGH